MRSILMICGIDMQQCMFIQKKDFIIKWEIKNGGVWEKINKYHFISYIS